MGRQLNDCRKLVNHYRKLVKWAKKADFLSFSGYGAALELIFSMHLGWSGEYFTAPQNLDSSKKWN